jgi:hypothetical protein
MTRNIIDELKRFVDDQTNQVGVVANLDGVIQSPSVLAEDNKTQQWFVGTVTVANPNLQGVLQEFTFERAGYETIDSESGGTLSYPKTGTINKEKTVFFTGLIRVANKRDFSIRVRSEGALLSVYVNGVQVASGADNLQQTVRISEGNHPLVIVAFKPSNTVTIQTDKTIEIVRAEAETSPPTWFEYPEIFAIDPSKGKYINRMAWNNDPAATGWNVYRASTTELADITSDVPTLNGDATVTFNVKTSSPNIEENDVLYTQYFPLGIVLSSVPFIGPLSEDWTTVTLIADQLSEPTLALWEGLRVFKEGKFEAVGAVSNAGNDFVSFDDPNIIPNVIYVYKLTAIGSLGITESEFSQSYRVWTYDEDPPRSISAAGFDQDGLQVTINYTNPDDPDFAGIRVYGPYPISGGDASEFSPGDTVLTKFGTPGATDQIRFRVDDTVTNSYFYVATFDHLGNEQHPSSYTVYSTGTVTEAAYRLSYTGPASPEESSTAISVTINPADIRNTEIQTVLILSVYPKAATIQAWVDRVLLTSSTQVISGRTYPAITLTDGTPPERNVYEVIIQSVEGSTVEFIATSSETGLKPFTVIYRSDIDPFPGVSGVHVEDKKERPRIFATMDDDAQWLRLVNTGTSATVFTATKTAGTDTPTVDYNTVLLDYTWATDLTPNQIVGLRIDASKDGSTWRTGVWTGSIQGVVKTASIKLTAGSHTDVNGNIIHDLTMVVSPASATVAATLNGADITSSLVGGSTDSTYDNKTYTISISQTVSIQKFVMTAIKTGYFPDSTHYTMDMDDIPGLDSVSVADTRIPIVITAYCDDDAKLLRFVKIVGSVHTPDSAIDVSSVKVATKNVSLASGAEETWAIELKGTIGGPYDSYREVWRQIVKATQDGPTLSVKAAPGVPSVGFYRITFSGDSLQLSIDGGTFGSAGTSPTDVARPAAGAQSKVYTYQATKNGQTIQDSVTIPSIDLDTVTPDLTVTQTGNSATQTTFQATATNPQSGGAAPTITVTPVNCTMVIGGTTFSTVQTISSGTSVIANRPAFAAGQASLIFRATISGGGAETIGRTIPNTENDSQFCMCTAKVTSSDATSATVTVTATHPSGTPTVGLVSNTASLVSGHAAGTFTYAQNGTDNVWVFSRSAFQTGLSQAIFRAHLASSGTGTTAFDDDDVVVIADQGRDTVGLAVVATPVSSTSTTLRVNVTTFDPLNGASITLTHSQVGSGLTVTKVGGGADPATFSGSSSGTTIAYDIVRPTFNTGTGRVTFTATASGRTTDADSVDVPAAEKTSFGPSIKVTVTKTSTTWTLAWTDDGSGATITLSIDGGSYTTPGSNPIIVTLDGDPHVYAFKAVLDGQTVPDTITIPAAPVAASAGFTSISFTKTFTPCDGGGAGTLNFSTSGLPVGTTFDAFFTITDSTYGTHGATVGSVNNGDSLTVSLCSDSTGYVTLTANFSGGQIATGVGYF